MTTKRSFALPGLVLVTVLAVAGCGGQQFPTTAAHPVPTTTGAPAVAQTPQARLLAAAQRTTAEKTARLAMHMSIVAGGDAALTLDGDGVIDLTKQSMDLTFTLKADGDTEAVELRVIDRVAYSLEGGRWVSQPFAGQPVSSLTPDPTSYLEFLQGLSGNVRVVGHELLRGVQTTRYSATVDLGRALTRVSKSAAQSAVMRDALSQFGDLEVPVTAWVDAAGRLRKLDLAMDVSGIASKLELGAAVAPKIDITMEFYEFGVPVDVVVPPGVISAQAAAADAVAQSDLRNALTAEKTLYTDDQMYTADAPTLKQVEPTLGWGTKLPVAVADASGQPDQVVCLSERSASGSTFAIADVATGFGAGTYFAKSACPAVVTEQTVSAMAKSW